MTQPDTAAIPYGLTAEYALLWAIVERAKLDIAYQPRPGVLRPEATEADRQDAIEFLRDWLADLQPVCA